MDIRLDKIGDVITIDVKGNAFLPDQVRRMTGALVDVGRGALTSETVASMLDGAGETATARSLPARGLCLLKVDYPENIFEE